MKTFLKLKKKIASIERYLNVSTRALPDFLIIGAQKCATTSLYYYLKQHSQVEPGLGEKEPDYFEKHNHYGMRWYQSNFPTREPSKLYFEA